MAVDLTLRLVKGTELTFAEIDNNWQLLDNAMDSLDSYFNGQISNLDSDLLVIRHEFDSNLDSAVNKIILIHDSDTQKHLADHDSDLSAGFARHDSEHAWNVREHQYLDSKLDSFITLSINNFDSINGGFNQINVEINNLDSNINNQLDSLTGSLEEIVGGLTIDSVAPDPAKEGEMWLDVNDDLVKVYDGDYWFEFPTNSQIDSVIVNGLIDADYISNIIDSNYIGNIIDSNYITNIIDSTYVYDQIGMEQHHILVGSILGVTSSVAFDDVAAVSLLNIDGGTY